MPILATKNNEFVINHDGDLMITVSPVEPWSDAIWREYLELIATYHERFGVQPGVLNFSPTQSPSATQRNILGTEFKDKTHVAELRRVVVLTDSALARGVLTALTWLLPNSRKMHQMAFKSTELDEALEWLAKDLTFDVARARALYREMLAVGGYDPETQERRRSVPA
jgi:hypothetical protein